MQRATTSDNNQNCFPYFPVNQYKMAAFIAWNKTLPSCENNVNSSLFHRSFSIDDVIRFVFCNSIHNTRTPSSSQINIASSLFCYWTICLSSEVFLLSPVSFNVRISASSKGKTSCQPTLLQQFSLSKNHTGLKINICFENMLLFQRPVAKKKSKL